MLRISGAKLKDCRRLCQRDGLSLAAQISGITGRGVLPHSEVVMSSCSPVRPPCLSNRIVPLSPSPLCTTRDSMDGIKFSKSWGNCTHVQRHAHSARHCPAISRALHSLQPERPGPGWSQEAPPSLRPAHVLVLPLITGRCFFKK